MDGGELADREDAAPLAPHPLARGSAPNRRSGHRSGALVRDVETIDFDPARVRGDSTISVRAASVGDDDQPGFASGEQVGGRYRILRFLARGAVGEVYAAHDEELGVDVALKALRGERASDGLSLLRFRREVLLTRALAHPGICRVFDLGVHEGPCGERVPFLTMELLTGETLASRLERGPLGLDAALGLAEKLAAAIGAAHAAGVIHRDLKPANIMLVSDRSAPGGERAVIMDFGLARRTAPAGDASCGGGQGVGGTGRAGGGGDGVGEADAVRLDGGVGVDDRATATGALVGSPAYMAPEQVAGLDLGPAADLYSLGVVLFEVVTGRLPFEADSLLALISSRMERDAPAAGAFKPGLDVRWDTTIARCLERDPALRFARAEDIPRALTAGLERVGPRRSWWRRPAAPAVVASVVLAIGAALLGGPGSRAAHLELEERAVLVSRR